MGHPAKINERFLDLSSNRVRNIRFGEQRFVSPDAIRVDINHGIWINPAAATMPADTIPKESMIRIDRADGGFVADLRFTYGYKWEISPKPGLRWEEFEWLPIVALLSNEAPY